MAPQPKSTLEILDIIGKLVVGVATVIIAALAFILSVSVRELTAREDMFSNADLRQKAILNLAESDEERRELAIVALAEFGEESIQTVRMLLGLEIPRLQKRGVQISKHLFSSQILREKFAKQLIQWSEERNPRLRAGVIETFIEMGDEAANYRSNLVDKISARICPDIQGKTNENDPDVALEVAKLLSILDITTATNLAGCLTKTFGSDDQVIREMLDSLKRKILERPSEQKRESLLKTLDSFTPPVGVRREVEQLRQILKNGLAKPQ
jgi:hypothetical protein